MNFKDGEIENVIIESVSLYNDQRGWLAEFFRHDEIPKEILPVMGYVSLTHPDIARGPHEHLGQWDYFVFLGPSVFEMYLWDNRKNSPTYQNRIKITVGEGYPFKIAVPQESFMLTKILGIKTVLCIIFQIGSMLDLGKRKG